MVEKCQVANTMTPKKENKIVLNLKYKINKHESIPI